MHLNEKEFDYISALLTEYRTKQSFSEKAVKKAIHILATFTEKE